ncbi:MAG: DUF2490 domain-containing protein [Salibacteraceae bacterium]
MRSVISIFFYFIFSIGFQALSQNQTGAEIWTDYFHYHKLSGKWQFYSDAGVRFQSLNTSDNDWWRLHIRPSISYRRTTLLDLRGGIGIIYNNNDGNENSTYFEFRPWQGAKIYWPVIGKLRFENYLRLEERMTYNEQENETGFSFKGRYQISTKVPLKNTSIVPNSFFIPISLELFGDLFLDGEQYRSDKLRVTSGIGYRKTRNLDFLLRGIFQKSPTHDGVDAVIRFTVKQHFGF